MKLEQRIMQELVVGTAHTIQSIADRHGVTYAQAQRVLRQLWVDGVLKRHWSGRLLMYEGRQYPMRIVARPSMSHRVAA